MTMKSLGKKISQFRKLKDLTQKEFSKLANITYRYYQDIEAGRANLRLSTTASIASHLEIPLQALFDQNISVDLFKAGVADSWHILEQLPMGICIVNLEGRILYLNDYFKLNLISDVETKDLTQMFVWDLLPEGSKSEGKLDFLQVIRNRPELRPRERTYDGPGQKFQQVAIYWDYIYDKSGVVKGFVSGVVPMKR